MKTNTWIKHILLLTFLLVLASQLKSQKLPEQDYNKLDQLLQKKFSEKFGLSILIAGNKKIIFNEAYGYIRKRGTGHDIFLIISYLGKTSCLF